MGWHFVNQAVCFKASTHTHSTPTHVPTHTCGMWRVARDTPRASRREWHELFSRDLKEWGFENGHADPCLYTKTDPKTKEVLRVLLFVDDLACFANPNSALLKSFKRQIEAKYNYSSNDANVYLGMTVTKVDQHTYHLGQQRYIRTCSRSTA